MGDKKPPKRVDPKPVDPQKAVRATKAAAMRDKLEGPLLQQIVGFHLPVPEREYRFDSKRRFRFDFAWPDLLIAAECEGGVWTNGAHSRGKHYTSDCEKYNLAALAGWRIFRFTTDMISDGTAIATIESALIAARNAAAKETT